ncbi:ABC transporter substrate-binding protein [Allorhizobium pseudoryzae]|uniref:ABC transporter substrate-binding protein n=1 Tax=Allorhizobium pseudoryzae TaxID=379684 RepID=UPI003CFFE0C4
MCSFRNSTVVALGIGLALLGTSAFAQAAKDITLLTWLGGPDRKVLDTLVTGFEAKHPDFKVKINVVTSQGDARGGMRTALMGGEKPDLVTNTWPAFRKELAEAGILRDVAPVWTDKGWDKALAKTWRDISTTGGSVYGIPYIFGYRSGIWHVPADLQKIGLQAFPTSYDDFLGTFDPLRKAGFVEPIAMPAKVYAHAEWFETLLMRTGGPGLVTDLGAHKVAWTDPKVAEALRQYARLFVANCCGDSKLMYATHWDDAADRIFVERKANFLQIGMWINARAISQYHLKPGVDFALGKFPALGRGFDNASIIDAKEMLATSIGSNPDGADMFLDYVLSPEGANLIAKAGFTTPSSNVDVSIYDPVAAASVRFVHEGEVRFVLGDMLPGSLVDEYRLALQQFIGNPTEANIAPTLARIEAAAARAY